MATVSFTDVSKSFAGGRTLLGPSGCGKSTLLNILAGFETLSSGTLRFDGKSVAKPGPDRGVVFQEASLLPWLSVWENVVFGPKVQGIARAIYEPKAEAILGRPIACHAWTRPPHRAFVWAASKAPACVRAPCPNIFHALRAQVSLAFDQRLLAKGFHFSPMAKPA